MKLRDDTGIRRRKQRAHSSFSSEPYLGAQASNGVPIQCQYCSGQTFRRSTLRSQDFTDLFLMRYPVRCLRCSQRQMVSFTIASLSLSSSIKPKRKPGANEQSSHWREPSPDSGVHQQSQGER
jgi:DNA-directed RNA polymerase subunit RPC12/RpoP